MLQSPLNNSVGQNEKLCIRWNDHESLICQTFNELRKDCELFDVTLCADDNEDDIDAAPFQIRAHKVLLSACSPVFKGVLAKQAKLPTNHSNPLIYLRGVSVIDLRYIINFIYQGEVNVSQKDLSSFLAAADNLKIRGLATQFLPDSNNSNTKDGKNEMRHKATKNNDNNILSDVNQSKNLTSENCDSLKRSRNSPTSSSNMNHRVASGESPPNKKSTIADEANEIENSSVISPHRLLTSIKSEPNTTTSMSANVVGLNSELTIHNEGNSNDGEFVLPSSDDFTHHTGHEEVDGHTDDNKPIHDPITYPPPPVTTESGPLQPNLLMESMLSTGGAEMDSSDESAAPPSTIMLPPPSSLPSFGMEQGSATQMADGLSSPLSSMVNSSTPQGSNAVFVVNSHDEEQRLIEAKTTQTQLGYVCMVCYVCAKTKKEIGRHFQAKHCDNGLAYLCPECKKSWNVRRYFIRHINRSHPHLKGLDYNKCIIERQE